MNEEWSAEESCIVWGAIHFAFVCENIRRSHTTQHGNSSRVLVLCLDVSSWVCARKKTMNDILTNGWLVGWLVMWRQPIKLMSDRVGYLSKGCNDQSKLIWRHHYGTQAHIWHHLRTGNKFFQFWLKNGKLMTSSLKMTSRKKYIFWKYVIL